MVPGARLLWILAAVAFPVTVAGGLAPSGSGVLALAIVLVIALFALWDAWISRTVLDSIEIRTPDLVRLYRDREGLIPVTFHVANPMDQRRRSLRVGLPLPESMETPEEIRTVILDPIPVSEVPWTCTGRRRGLFRIKELFVECRSSLGLWDIRRKASVDLELRVYPNLREPDALAAIRRGAQGMSVQRQVGKGREFEKLREYQPGDGFDEIHWKASARRGKPITKVFQVERTQEIYVIIDAGRLSGRPAGKDLTLERYIQAALVLGSAAERNGDLFGLVTFSDQVHGFVRARNGKAHYSACRDSLYQLHPRNVSPDFDEVASFLRTKIRHRALLVFLTELDDPLLAEGFSRAVRLLSAQHVVMAGMLKPQEVSPLFAAGSDPVTDDNDVYRKLSSHAAWRGLKETEIALRRQGAWFSMFTPDAVCRQLVNSYMDIKQRQIL
jgi:uncharacterized protein (DUF58 family)